MDFRVFCMQYTFRWLLELDLSGKKSIEVELCRAHSPDTFSGLALSIENIRGHNLPKNWWFSWISLHLLYGSVWRHPPRSGLGSNLREISESRGNGAVPDCSVWLEIIICRMWAFVNLRGAYGVHTRPQKPPRISKIWDPGPLCDVKVGSPEFIFFRALWTQEYLIRIHAGAIVQNQLYRQL